MDEHLCPPESESISRNTIGKISEKRLVYLASSNVSTKDSQAPGPKRHKFLKGTSSKARAETRREHIAEGAKLELHRAYLVFRHRVREGR
jgi:hypothetical protein